MDKQKPWAWNGAPLFARMSRSLHWKVHISSSWLKSELRCVKFAVCGVLLSVSDERRFVVTAQLHRHCCHSNTNSQSFQAPQTSMQVTCLVCFDPLMMANQCRILEALAPAAWTTDIKCAKAQLLSRRNDSHTGLTNGQKCTTEGGPCSL